jgi:hypothetical protein
MEMKNEPPAGYPHKVEFTKARVKQLRQEYAVALAAKQESFVFDGRQMMTSYAKYVLEYLEKAS